MDHPIPKTCFPASPASTEYNACPETLESKPDVRSDCGEIAEAFMSTAFPIKTERVDQPADLSPDFSAGSGSVPARLRRELPSRRRNPAYAVDRRILNIRGYSTEILDRNSQQKYSTEDTRQSPK